MGMAAMYSGFYPAFRDTMEDMAESVSEQFSFIPGAQDMASYVGFLNIELYQIFWILILGILIGFLAASIIAKEIEAKTIDLFMSNPISRKQIVLEKYVGIIPTILIVNCATIASVYGVTLVIDEEINLGYLIMTHIASIPYFLAVAGLGIVISVIVNEKMKASIIMIALIVGMFIFQSISLLASEYEWLGFLSFTHYYYPYDILKAGNVDVVGQVILIVIAIECILIAMLYFDNRDIHVT
jgi:ABC-2 type transport system permease protein